MEASILHGQQLTETIEQENEEKPRLHVHGISIKRASQDPSTSMTMQRLRRQRPFLESILQESNRFKRQALLQHANKDQINAVSEMVLNLLKNNIPVKPQTLRSLQRHKKVLREVGKRKNSVKRRRQHLLKQTGAGFWRGLKACYGACRCRRVMRRGTR